MTFTIISIVLVVLVIILAFVFTYIERKDDRSHLDRRGRRLISHDRITDKKGEEGEKSVAYYLRQLLADGEHCLTNLLISFKNKPVAEIDAVLISKKGLFCIEIKNWAGRISGTDTSENWLQEYDDITKGDQPHRNPVVQNQNHCDILKRKLRGKYNVTNIVIFLEIEEKGELHSSCTYTLEEFIATYEDRPNVLYLEDIEDIYDILKECQATKEELENYKEEVRIRHPD